MNRSREVRVLHEGGRFFEGPRWHDGRWYVSDFYPHTVTAFDERGHAERIIDVPGQPSGLGWLADGSLLIVSMTDHRLLRRWPDGRVSEHADLTEHCGGWANDMVVDGRGRAYVGNFGFALVRGSKPQPASLIRVDPDGSVAVVADDLLFPNGTVITPDGGTLVIGETFRNRYTAFTIQSNGSLTDRRTWADLTATADRPKLSPDGCALDADGYIWSADAGLGQLNRIGSDGHVREQVEPPQGLKFFACALGGGDGRTLLGCAARGYFEAQESDSLDAVLVTARVDVPHAGWP
jgi:sugar lactone lactonase YvrE